jgi:hypothetical protein
LEKIQGLEVWRLSLCYVEWQILYRGWYWGKIGMTESSSKKTNVAAFLAILVVSAATMVLLFWRFPLTTALITLAIFVALGISARLARAIEVIDVSDIEHGEPSV